MNSDFLLTQPLVSLMFICNIAMVGLGVACCVVCLFNFSVYTRDDTTL